MIGLPQDLQGLVRNSVSMGSGLETGLEAGSVVVWVPFEKIFFIKSNKGYPPDLILLTMHTIICGKENLQVSRVHAIVSPFPTIVFNLICNRIIIPFEEFLHRLWP